MDKTLRLSLAIVAAAFFLAIQLAPAVPPAPTGDKIGHVLLYAGLTVGVGLFWPLRRILAPLLVSAFVFEGIHAFLPGRAFETGDIAANLLGVYVGALVLDVLTFGKLEPLRKP